MIVTEQAVAGPSAASDGGPIVYNDEHDDVFAQPTVSRRLTIWSRNKAGQMIDGWHSFRIFMWNRDKGQVMGRNGKSWAQIGLFYLCFYCCLAGFFAAMFAIFYQTISEERPTYNSLITPPGLHLFPFPGQQRRIEYGLSNDDADRLRIEREIRENVFDVLGVDQSTYVDCPDTADTIANPPQQRFCRYDPSLLGPCAPNNSGYDTRQPCLYMGLNKVWGWVPVGYEPDELELFFSGTVYASANYSTRIFITCEGVREEDEDNIDSINIYPQEGISFGHYPYVVGTDPAQQARYIRPVVAAKVKLNTPDVDVRIECKARAKNIPDVAEGGLFGSREEPSRFRIRIMVRGS